MGEHIGRRTRAGKVAKTFVVFVLAAASCSPQSEPPQSESPSSALSAGSARGEQALVELRPTNTPTPLTRAPASIPLVSTPALTSVPQATSPPLSTPLVGVGQQALDLVPFDWASLGYEISFHPGQPGLRGLTFTRERRIEIYVRSSDTPSDLAHVVAHEIGHAVDVERNSADDRRQWLEVRGAPADGPWWPGEVDDFASGAGDFAECFASWTVGSPSYSRLAGGCDPAALELVARLSES